MTWFQGTVRIIGWGWVAILYDFFLIYFLCLLFSSKNEGLVVPTFPLFQLVGGFLKKKPESIYFILHVIMVRIWIFSTNFYFIPFNIYPKWIINYYAEKWLWLNVKCSVLCNHLSFLGGPHICCINSTDNLKVYLGNN